MSCDGPGLRYPQEVGENLRIFMNKFDRRVARETGTVAHDLRVVPSLLTDFKAKSMPSAEPIQNSMRVLIRGTALLRGLKSILKSF